MLVTYSPTEAIFSDSIIRMRHRNGVIAPEPYYREWKFNCVLLLDKSAWDFVSKRVIDTELLSYDDVFNELQDEYRVYYDRAHQFVIHVGNCSGCRACDPTMADVSDSDVETPVAESSD
jgi:hypothetical protein